MLSRFLVAVVFIALLMSQMAVPLRGQMQSYAEYKGELLPVVTSGEGYVHVLKDGRKQQVWDTNCRIRPASQFAEGFVEVVDIQADLNALDKLPPKERVLPDAIRFEYQAKLVADRSMSDCYALLSFITEGSVGTKLIPIGRLGKGNPKAIKLKLPTKVDSIGSLHVFANGLEVRSTQHREAYDVVAYYGALTKNVRGLSAVELLKAENVFAHELSTDGHLLATVRLRDAKKILIAYDLESMKQLCELPVADSDRDVAGLEWISDHEVAYVAEVQGTDGWYKRNLYLLNLQTAQTKKISDDVFAILAALADKPEVLVIYRGWCTEQFDVRTGKSSGRQEFRAGPGNYMFDRYGNDRLFMEYEGDKISYSFRATPGAKWREIDEAVKQPGLRFNVRGPQLLDRVVDVHSIGPDSDTLYVSTRLGGSDKFELAAFSMSEGVIKRTIAKHPKYDLTTEDGGLSRLLFAKNSPQLLGIIYEAQKPQVVWLDPKYASVQQAMDKTFPDHVNLPIDWSKDGGTFIYYSANEQDPGTFYVFKPLESRLIPLLELGERLKAKTLAKTEAFEFTARDGQKIPAYVTRPTTSGNGPAPLIVSIHGGPMARDSWVFNPQNQYFASRGYIVLQVNYRGSSGYGAAFQNAGLRARLDTVVLDDIADGVRYLIDQKEADPTRVAVMGASFGGWATYMSLIKYPELYRAGIAIAAISNWRTSIRESRWEFGNKLGYTFWKSLLSRGSFAEDEKFIDPYLRATELKQPVFIMHGEFDTIVSANEAKMMLNALKKSNPNVRSRSFPWASHTYWPFADRVVMLNEISVFLDQYLGKSDAPVPFESKP